LGQEGDDMQRVQVFRCVICGDPYIGFERPTNCPFCGAHEQYIIPSYAWRDTNKMELTDISRKNLESSLELETGNAEFYLCISKTAKSVEIRAMFKALSKVESEHASTICKILGTEKPTTGLKKELCAAMSEQEILKEAERRENRAVKLYNEFLKQATEPRVIEFFTALIEIESDHIDIVTKESSEPAPMEKEGNEKPPRDEELKKLDREDIDFYDSYSMYED